ncbi:hypothetical protein C9F11_29945 [Streptomyces sp. YIM 121038]|uniref:DUF4192 family protein n=1 Tax=Streptomyces sp. YIM 121038 TaxID=2136401 RepID=UPI001165AC5A|nr:DUF4192 family protein [Streptomyces sp. YIM 121038]QCX79580.1 hypothetical protein C9F11_29945 [Streptomyces sp. YIM 121038]
MTQRSESADPIDETIVTLRTPAELADALPYLLGFRPENSVVLIALHGPRGRFGGRVRLGIPERPDDWPSVAEQLAQCLVSGSERREARPDGVVAFLCQEPEAFAGDASGQQVMERLRPLAQALRTECGDLDVPVLEVVCVSDGRFWTYCCPDQRCCPSEGTPLLPAGTSVLAAATVYAGFQVGPAQGRIRARLAPWRTAAASDQARVLHDTACALVPRILGDGGHAEVAAETLALARRVMARLAAAPPIADTLEADVYDDELIGHEEAAALILGLQDRTTRDRSAEWMEGDEAAPALRLWRALARRCVREYREHAAAPLTLAGWVAWSLGDLAEGQEALTMALIADPHYAFALLLHPACSADDDPEPIRRILRGERAQRDATAQGRNPVRSAVRQHAEAAASGGRSTETSGAEHTEVREHDRREGDNAQGGVSAAKPDMGTEKPRKNEEAEDQKAPGAPEVAPPGSSPDRPDNTDPLEHAGAGVGVRTAPRGRRRPPRTSGPGSRPVGDAGTGPRNRRDTIRRGARHDR